MEIKLSLSSLICCRLPVLFSVCTLAAVLGGCALGPVETGLYENATHTGTITLYRVPPHPEVSGDETRSYYPASYRCAVSWI